MNIAKLMQIVFFSLIVSNDLIAGDLTCSQDGTTLIYVNDSSISEKRANSIRDSLADRYSEPARKANIDEKSKVFYDNLVLPTFGSTKDEIIALELELKANDSNFSLLNKLRANKLGFYDTAEIPDYLSEQINGGMISNIVDIWSKFKAISDVIDLWKAGESTSKAFATKDAVVRHFQSNILEQAKLIQPKIKVFQKNIYIAHGAGGFYLDAILDEINKQDAGYENLFAKFEKYNSVVYIENVGSKIYHKGVRKKAFINFYKIPITHRPDGSTLPISKLFSFLGRFNPFTEIYLENVKAFTVGENNGSSRLITDILDESIYYVAQGIQNNCKPEIKSVTTSCHVFGDKTYSRFNFFVDYDVRDNEFYLLNLNDFYNPQVFSESPQNYYSEQKTVRLQLADSNNRVSDPIIITNPCVHRATISASISCPEIGAPQSYNLSYDISSPGRIKIGFENPSSWDFGHTAYNLEINSPVSPATVVNGIASFPGLFPSTGSVVFSFVPTDPSHPVASTTAMMPFCGINADGSYQ